MQGIVYLCDGKLCRFGKEGARELPNGILDRAAERIRVSARREEWKTSGSGARFMQAEAGGSAEERVAALHATVGGFAFLSDRLAFSLTIDEVSGIYTKRDPDDTEEGILVSDNTRAFGDLARAKDGLLVSVAYAGMSHIGILKNDTREVTLLSDGRTVDSAPAVDPADGLSFYFSSAGLSEQEEEAEEDEAPMSLPDMLLAMHRPRNASLLGPAAILKMDAGRTTLSEVLSDPRYDHLRPSVGEDGTLYYLRRPYRPEKSGSSLLGCLTDILLFPWNLLRALFGFFNFFTMKYAGKPLSHGGRVARGRSERDVFLEGNRIEAERELRRNRRDEFPGIVPASYELRCRRPSGEDVLLARGVYAYALREDGILLSNGSSILRLLPNGKREKVADVPGVTRLL